MGHVEHQAIVCTGYAGMRLSTEIAGRGVCIEEAHVKAGEVFGACVSPLISSGTNGYASFLVAPDGSKSGWPDDEDGDKRRREFIEWLDAGRWSDGGTSVDWVALNYGADSDWAHITAHSQEPSRGWLAQGRQP